MTSVEERPAEEAPAQGEYQTGAWWWIRTIVSWFLLLAAAAVLAALVVVPRVSGATPYTVLTGSMEPTLSPGSLIVVKPVPPEELHAGDVITFQIESGNQAVNTHRITQVVYDAQGRQRIRTHGDANSIPDKDMLVAEQVRGRLWYSVPYLGYVNNAMTGDSRQRLVMVAVGGLGVYAVWMFGSGLRDRSREKKGPGVSKRPIDSVEGVGAGHDDSA
ncbi:signal peptidase I [Dietzia sp. NPDC055343]